VMYEILTFTQRTTSLRKTPDRRLMAWCRRVNPPLTLIGYYD
jgi:hypothetical protein